MGVAVLRRAGLMLALLALACSGKGDDTAGGCMDGAGCLLVDGAAAGLLSVRAPADDDVWITGAAPDASKGPVLLHFDGAAWETLDTSAWPGAELWWGYVTPTEGIFVGSGGLLLELDRATGAFTQVTGPSPDTTFFGVWGASGDDVWAVGQRADAPPAIWRRLGGTWAAQKGPDTVGQSAFKVHGTAHDDVWIVGSQGMALHWDGAALATVPTDGEAQTASALLLTVDVGGERPIAVGGAGNGLVLEYDGTVWRDLSPDFQPGYNGVCTGAGRAVAVGVAGIRAERLEGAWVPDSERDIDTFTFDDWHGCAVSPSGDLWSVGGRIASRPLKDGIVSFQGASAPPSPPLD